MSTENAEVWAYSKLRTQLLQLLAQTKVKRMKRLTVHEIFGMMLLYTYVVVVVIVVSASDDDVPVAPVVTGPEVVSGVDILMTTSPLQHSK